MDQATHLTGVRAAVQRSAAVGVLACALAGLALCLLPGRVWVTEVVDATGVHEVIDHEAAGGPLLMIALTGVVLVAGLAVVQLRREVAAFVGGALTMLALPLVVWLGFSSSVGLDSGEPLWAASALDACVASLVVAGPLLAALGFALFRLEARVVAAPVPAARQVAASRA
ncbi:MAG: hypothetical protein IPL61_32495 [Myxococcales bacterium]|nr:hypothetical protein [Myxococcales bacterium]